MSRLRGQQAHEDTRLNDVEKDFMEHLTSAPPTIISRAKVDRFPPGLVKPQTLAQADSIGTGPEK